MIDQPVGTGTREDGSFVSLTTATYMFHPPKTFNTKNNILGNDIKQPSLCVSNLPVYLAVF